MSSIGFGVLALRIMAVALFFPFSTLDKLLNFGGAVGQCGEVFRPRVLATLVIMGGVGIEVCCSGAIISGYADRLGAAVLGGYCWVTALLFKRFWRPGDFWSNPGGQGRALFWDFWKNLALGAALVLLAIGADGSHARELWHDPLASTHLYGSAAK